ncbi:uncharacterized protein LOC143298018 isoform X2 [Babylonia areolata]|uniref:uncharacterized protein LOC143298018 isoform X2 n=1 Tax=Babylonia areolata TaxID=304850 RepID=UPI003FD4FEE8
MQLLLTLDTEGSVSASGRSLMASDPLPMIPPQSPVRHSSSVVELYRRPLPDSCIAFASDEGKAIFREALGTGHLNCYFRLASQFRTQDEPAYCGLATLVMVLNALEIDPGRVWKGPWKWYHEDMLDCCVPTQIMRKEGITFDEFICLADCNYLDTEAVRVDSSCREDSFRDLVKTMTLREDSFLVVSYSRKTLQQTGDGHFAPVSGYHPGRDLVLILDTARFKYPPHWVSLPLLFEAMQRLDKSTGLPRGYLQLWPSQNAKSLLLFKTSEQFSVNASPQGMETYEGFVAAWNGQLMKSLSPAHSPSLAEAVRQGLQGLVSLAGTVGDGMVVLRTQGHISCTHACNLQCIVVQLLSELQATEMFRAVCGEVVRVGEDALRQLESLFGVWPSVVRSDTVPDVVGMEGDREGGKRRCCNMNQFLCLCDFLTAFFLSWPYPTPTAPDSLGAALNRGARGTLEGSGSQLLTDEVTTLHRQLKKLSGFHTPTAQSPHSEGQPQVCCAAKSCGHKDQPAGRTQCCSEKKEK